MNYLTNVALFIADFKQIILFMQVSKKCKNSVHTMKINGFYSKSHINDMINIYQHLQTLDGRNKLKKIELRNFQQIQLFKNPNECILNYQEIWRKIESIIVRKKANLLFKNITSFIQLRRIELWIDSLTYSIEKIKGMRTIRTLIIHCTEPKKMIKLLPCIKTFEFDRINVIIIIHSFTKMLLDKLKEIKQIKVISYLIDPLTIDFILKPLSSIIVSPDCFNNKETSYKVLNQINQNYNSSLIISSKYFTTVKFSNVKCIDLSQSTSILELNISVLFNEYNLFIPIQLLRLTINSINPNIIFSINNITELHLQNVERKNELSCERLVQLELISCKNIKFKKVPLSLQSISLNSCSYCIIPISSSLKHFRREFCEENQYLITENNEVFGSMFKGDNSVISYEKDSSLYIKSCYEINCSEAQVKEIIIFGSIDKFINTRKCSIRFSGCGSHINKMKLSTSSKVICESGTTIQHLIADSIDHLIVNGEIKKISCSSIRMIEITELKQLVPVECKFLLLKRINKTKINLLKCHIKHLILCNVFSQSLYLPNTLMKIVSRNSKIEKFVNLENCLLSINRVINMLIHMNCQLTSFPAKISKLKLKNIKTEFIDLSMVHCTDVKIIYSSCLRKILVSEVTLNVYFYKCNDNIIVQALQPHQLNILYFN
ncbi:hypothetical protein EDI_141220 [Entamoeba dispar SAW760]|uniref:Uncharacterized protein n=1 Tax=Entamoeba dispar (strain ATCC PRA-260 / SAW760) TaxID=370354 RepID=B0EDX5_ENTDS|nr:uncharacterized protein EDI_141220 [Entamoeba dispar SAW760]EDR27287.1 hypothetical protein EDI_141220 [Entamoeba dispar SAW760]|eukprot:EDR27287.1 hypothetical protein EDI_141220 [Entamoeba dispar SAW760]